MRLGKIAVAVVVAVTLAASPALAFGLFMDPNGRVANTDAGPRMDDNGRSSFIDPNGKGYGMDPNGRDEGCHIEPNGGCGGRVFGFNFWTWLAGLFA